MVAGTAQGTAPRAHIQCLHSHTHTTAMHAGSTAISASVAAQHSPQDAILPTHLILCRLQVGLGRVGGSLQDTAQHIKTVGEQGE